MSAACTVFWGDVALQVVYAELDSDSEEEEEEEEEDDDDDSGEFRFGTARHALRCAIPFL